MAAASPHNQRTTGGHSFVYVVASSLLSTFSYLRDLHASHLIDRQHSPHPTGTTQDCSARDPGSHLDVRRVPAELNGWKSEFTASIDTR